MLHFNAQNIYLSAVLLCACAPVSGMWPFQETGWLWMLIVGISYRCWMAKLAPIAVTTVVNLRLNTALLRHMLAEDLSGCALGPRFILQCWLKSSRPPLGPGLSPAALPGHRSRAAAAHGQCWWRPLWPDWAEGETWGVKAWVWQMLENLIQLRFACLKEDQHHKQHSMHSWKGISCN